MNKILVVSITLGVFLLSGCGPQTPLQKLSSNQVFEDLNASFWSKEAASHSHLWQQAVDFCNEHEEKPNCATVDQLQILSRGSTKIVPFGTSGRYLSAPDFPETITNDVK